MKAFNKWMTSLVPGRSNRSCASNCRVVDLERQCIDFETWFKMNAHLYTTSDSHRNTQARKDYKKWLNGFDPVQARNRKRIFHLWKSNAN